MLKKISIVEVPNIGTGVAKKAKIGQGAKKIEKTLAQILKTVWIASSPWAQRTRDRVPLEKEVAFPLNLVGKGGFFFRLFKVKWIDGFIEPVFFENWIV